MKKNCAIIGAGVAGMATAIRLKKLGFEVHVFERRQLPGGKLDQLEMQGFRFDMGPTVFTMPQLIDELFELHGIDPTPYFSYTRLKDPVRYFFQDGLTIDAHADVNQYAAEVEKKLNLPRKRFFRYILDAAKKFNLTHDVFLRSSLHRVSNYMRWTALKGILLFSKVGVFRSMSQRNQEILANRHMERIVNRYAQYNGSDPYRMPSTFNVIGHVEMSRGVFVVKGGVFAISKALHQLAEMVGVQFHFGAEVEEITLKGNIVKGLKVRGEQLPFDVVVSNADIVFTHDQLLKSSVRAEQLKAREKSSSAVLFYFGVQGKNELFSTHNFLFGKDCKEEFTRVFSKDSVGDDFAIYLHISSKYQPEDAPENGENWFIMVNSPNDRGQDWEAEGMRLRKLILERISEKLGLHFEDMIVCEHMETPRTIAEKYRCYRGAIYGDSSNDMFAAFLRHPNFSRKYGHLFFTGGSVHPGAGIPLCFYSAEITSRLIEERE